MKNGGWERRAAAETVDFLLKYKHAGGVLIEPDYLRVHGRPKSRDLLSHRTSARIACQSLQQPCLHDGSGQNSAPAV